MNSDFPTPTPTPPLASTKDTRGFAIRVFFGAVIFGIIVGYLYLEFAKNRNREKFANCTVLSEDLVLCEGAFCNPSTEVCNYLFLEE